MPSDPFPYHIRPLTARDVPHLADLRPGFQSNTVLRVRKTGSGYTVGWELVEVALDTPFDKGRGYDFDAQERQNVSARLQRDDTLLEVAVTEAGRIVGVLDVARQSWNEVAWVWNLMLDVDARGQGLGRHLMERTIDWARDQGLRAVMLETQSNNVPACKFYARLGFQLVGINEAFYTNSDRQQDEVALFWSYPLR